MTEEQETLIIAFYSGTMATLLQCETPVNYHRKGGNPEERLRVVAAR